MPLIVFLALMLTLLAAVSPLEAQRGNRQQEPRRPQLVASADTNDARAYYMHGTSQLESRNPRAAADAFYWASRIDPAWAEPLYARRIALLISDERRLMQYMDGERRVINSQEVRGIDSLYFQALTRDPFLFRRFDRLLLETYVSEWARRVQAANPSQDRLWLEYQMNHYFRTAGPGMRAWLAYSDRRLSDALEAYGSALRGVRDPEDRAAIHLSRARILVLLANFPDAHREITLALEESRKKDDRRLVFFYNAKTILEHTSAMIFETLGRRQEAREAYGRALQEDLSYHPAHVRLARLSLSEGDTLSALSALDLAVQIREDDAVLRSLYGSTLLSAGQPREAAEQLRRATEIEPYFAVPYRTLGTALESLGQTEEALRAYEGFLSRASRSDPALAATRQWAETLRLAVNTQP